MSFPEREPDGAPTPLLEVENLATHFPVRTGVLQRATGIVKAVDDVSLTVAKGETLGLVGESGSGKTTVGRTILRLIPATAGTVRFDGRDVLSATPGQMQALRRRMQIVFQDPAGSLNPHMRIGEIVAEPIRVHNLIVEPDRIRKRVGDLLERCGMPAASASRFPHEFSGGQRQRIGIARALATEPEFIVCDEPTSALDVSVQAQVLNLLRDLQKELGLSYLFISHDMAVVHHMCDRIAVMKSGRIVEQDERDRIIFDAQHPYTRALLKAVPRPRVPV